MSVQDILAKLPELSADEIGQVRAALDRLPRGSAGGDNSDPSAMDEVWGMIRRGWYDTNGRSLAEGIDVALYGPASQ